MKGVGEGIACPACGSTESEVKDSRVCHGGIRRRRLCIPCAGRSRFSTLELPVDDSLDRDKRAPLIGALDILVKMKRLPSAKQDLVMALIETFVADAEVEGATQ